MIEQGGKAPAITVTASDGSNTNLAAPGKPLVLYFYPKDDTTGCTLEAQNFTALAPEFAELSDYSSVSASGLGWFKWSTGQSSFGSAIRAHSMT